VAAAGARRRRRHGGGGGKGRFSVLFVARVGPLFFGLASRHMGIS
jgi:hypothetical protein